jgi:putative transposase
MKRRVNEHAGQKRLRWQPGYYEHVIRNEKALDRIRAYIANNPARWADDPENISRPVSAEAGRV